jgi:hypothetical protein
MLQACAQAVDFKVGHHFGEGQVFIDSVARLMVNPDSPRFAIPAYIPRLLTAPALDRRDPSLQAILESRGMNRV